MVNKKITLVEGDIFDGVLLETYKEVGISRPRVRPIDFLDGQIKVEFPRRPRENNPLRTRFRASVKVCQKYHKKGESKGKPKGNPYLYAYTDTIYKMKGFRPDTKIKPIKLNTISDRVYNYIYEENDEESEDIELLKLRNKAYDSSSKESTEYESSFSQSYRNDVIKIYAFTRSNGICEACEKPAPFLKKNDEPYLEIHHIEELSKKGSDHPKNVAAICPNCHARATHAKDAPSFNRNLRAKIIKKETKLGKS